MGENFIGPDELILIPDKIGIEVPSEIPIIPYNLEDLKKQTRRLHSNIGYI